MFRTSGQPNPLRLYGIDLSPPSENAKVLRPHISRRTWRFFFETFCDAQDQCGFPAPKFSGRSPAGPKRISKPPAPTNNRSLSCLPLHRCCSGFWGLAGHGRRLWTYRSNPGDDEADGVFSFSDGPLLQLGYGHPKPSASTRSPKKVCFFGGQRKSGGPFNCCWKQLPGRSPGF